MSAIINQNHGPEIDPNLVDEPIQRRGSNDSQVSQVVRNERRMTFEIVPDTHAIPPMAPEIRRMNAASSWFDRFKRTFTRIFKSDSPEKKISRAKELRTKLTAMALYQQNTPQDNVGRGVADWWKARFDGSFSNYCKDVSYQMDRLTSSGLPDDDEIYRDVAKNILDACGCDNLENLTYEKFQAAKDQIRSVHSRLPSHSRRARALERIEVQLHFEVAERIAKRPSDSPFGLELRREVEKVSREMQSQFSSLPYFDRMQREFYNLLDSEFGFLLGRTENDLRNDLNLLQVPFHDMVGSLHERFETEEKAEIRKIVTPYLERNEEPISLEELKQLRTEFKPYMGNAKSAHLALEALAECASKGTDEAKLYYSKSLTSFLKKNQKVKPLMQWGFSFQCSWLKEKSGLSAPAAMKAAIQSYDELLPSGNFEVGEFLENHERLDALQSAFQSVELENENEGLKEELAKRVEQQNNIASGVLSKLPEWLGQRCGSMEELQKLFMPGLKLLEHVAEAPHYTPEVKLKACQALGTLNTAYLKNGTEVSRFRERDLTLGSSRILSTANRTLRHVLDSGTIRNSQASRQLEQLFQDVTRQAEELGGKEPNANARTKYWSKLAVDWSAFQLPSNQWNNQHWRIDPSHLRYTAPPPLSQYASELSSGGGDLPQLVDLTRHYIQTNDVIDSSGSGNARKLDVGTFNQTLNAKILPLLDQPADVDGAPYRARVLLEWMLKELPEEERPAMFANFVMNCYACEYGVAEAVNTYYQIMLRSKGENVDQENQQETPNPKEAFKEQLAMSLQGHRQKLFSDHTVVNRLIWNKTGQRGPMFNLDDPRHHLDPVHNNWRLKNSIGTSTGTFGSWEHDKYVDYCIHAAVDSATKREQLQAFVECYTPQEVFQVARKEVTGLLNPSRETIDGIKNKLTQKIEQKYQNRVKELKEQNQDPQEVEKQEKILARNRDNALKTVDEEAARLAKAPGQRFANAFFGNRIREAYMNYTGEEDIIETDFGKINVDTMELVEISDSAVLELLHEFNILQRQPN